MTYVGVGGGVRRPWSQPEYKCHDGAVAQIVEQVLSERESSGRLSVMRATIRPQDAPPLHSHTHEDEFWLVLYGRVRFWIGGTALRECEVSEAARGAFVYAPRTVAHTFQTITAHSEIILGTTPGTLEGYFQTETDRDDPDMLSRYGCHVLAPPPIWGDWN